LTQIINYNSELYISYSKKTTICSTSTCTLLNALFVVNLYLEIVQDRDALYLRAFIQTGRIIFHDYTLNLLDI